MIPNLSGSAEWRRIHQGRKENAPESTISKKVRPIGWFYWPATFTAKTITTPSLASLASQPISDTLGFPTTIKNS